MIDSQTLVDLQTSYRITESAKYRSVLTIYLMKNHHLQLVMEMAIYTVMHQLYIILVAATCTLK